GWRMPAFAPRRIGPSMSSTDVNDDAQVGHRSTSVKTDHTTSIGASIVIDTRSTPSFPMLHSLGLIDAHQLLITRAPRVASRADSGCLTRPTGSARSQRRRGMLDARARGPT